MFCYLTTDWIFMHMKSNVFKFNPVAFIHRLMLIYNAKKGFDGRRLELHGIKKNNNLFSFQNLYVYSYVYISERSKLCVCV